MTSGKRRRSSYDRESRSNNDLVLYHRRLQQEGPLAPPPLFNPFPYHHQNLRNQQYGYAGIPPQPDPRDLPPSPHLNYAQYYYQQQVPPQFDRPVFVPPQPDQAKLPDAYNSPPHLSIDPHYDSELAFSGHKTQLSTIPGNTTRSRSVTHNALQTYQNGQNGVLVGQNGLPLPNFSATYHGEHRTGYFRKSAFGRGRPIMIPPMPFAEPTFERVLNPVHIDPRVLTRQPSLDPYMRQPPYPNVVYRDFNDSSEMSRLNQYYIDNSIVNPYNSNTPAHVSLYSSKDQHENEPPDSPFVFQSPPEEDDQDDLRGSPYQKPSHSEILPNELGETQEFENLERNYSKALENGNNSKSHVDDLSVERRFGSNGVPGLLRGASVGNNAARRIFSKTGTIKRSSLLEKYSISGVNSFWQDVPHRRPNITGKRTHNFVITDKYYPQEEYEL